RQARGGGIPDRVEEEPAPGLGPLDVGLGAGVDEEAAEQHVHAGGRAYVVGDARTRGDAVHADGRQGDALVVGEERRVAAAVEVDDRLLAETGGDRVLDDAGQLLGGAAEAAVADDVGGVAGQVGQLVDPPGAEGAVGRGEDDADAGRV